MYVGSTDELCRQATRVTGLPAQRLSNGVGLLLARRSDGELRRERTPGRVRIGYFSGTTTHDADWAMAEPALIAILDRHQDVELWLGGHLKPTPALEAFSDRIQRVPFVRWYDLPRVLRDTDISLAPLTPGSRFNEAKSAIKWLEAALVETPTVASPAEPFREVIEHGRTGLLASTPGEWIEALELLLGSEAERRRIGSQARREALLRFSPHRQGARYALILRDARNHVSAHGHRQPTDWEPVLDDEPFSDFACDVEPYAIPGHPARPARRRSVIREAVVRLGGRVREIASEEGIPGLTRRATRRAGTAIAVMRARLRR